LHELKKDKYQDLADTWRQYRMENSCIASSDLLQRFPISNSIEEQERQQHGPLGKLHKEHSVWLSKPNLKPMYVDEVIDHHYLPHHLKDVSSKTGRNIWWRMETQFSSDF